ncbi:hypothetical protein IQ07DRAFT_204584 [Pyrenochaeta sp. DS3sAY3a]|nr:hypothetical protein IQ07DRAFT_204584 [Pyrenochaeta sp. DS3sAY3a]
MIAHAALCTGKGFPLLISSHFAAQRPYGCSICFTTTTFVNLSTLAALALALVYSFSTKFKDSSHLLLYIYIYKLDPQSQNYKPAVQVWAEGQHSCISFSGRVVSFRWPSNCLKIFLKRKSRLQVHALTRPWAMGHLENQLELSSKLQDHRVDEPGESIRAFLIRPFKEAAALQAA